MQGQGDIASPAVAGIAAVAIASWELLSRSSPKIAFLISQPSEIVAALHGMAGSGSLLVDAGVTAAEALSGIAIGTVFGSALGLGLWMSRRAARIAAPFIGVAANFPVFALAPAAIVWLGIGVGMKVCLAAGATFFVSLQLAHQGARTAQEQFGGVFDGFRASRWDTYTKIIVPGALGSVFSSMRVSVGLGMLGAFIGEFIASENGLGRAILRASGLYQIDRVFAASLCIVALAGVFDRLALAIQQEHLGIARLCGLPRSLRSRARGARA
jgi:NitT/TauT family transport system permease protein